MVFLIEKGLTIECLDFVISRSDTNNIESVDDKKCFANYCTYVSTEVLLTKNNNTTWVPTRYARECTNQLKITIGSINVDSLNLCNLVYDSSQQVRYYTKICNSNFCNEQCDVYSYENSKNNNNNNINVYIGNNCCNNKSPNCCQNSQTRPSCCSKILPHWPPLGPQLTTQPSIPQDENDKFYLANIKCCSYNNPICCNKSEITNICCMKMLQIYKEPLIASKTDDFINSGLTDKNQLTKTYNGIMLNNICCKNNEPNCCSNNFNTIPCCNDQFKIMHPGPVIENSLKKEHTLHQKFEKINTPIHIVTNSNDNISNPFSNCCNEKNPFCCIPVETANECCLKVLYREQKVSSYPIKSITSLNKINSSNIKLSSKYLAIISLFIILYLIF
uniref:Phlebovirus_G2 domain-containing protein n=1 Tax=Strongyloides venezuelensis TaxID=75913 RepID=A0A0K0EWP2_STRVS